MEYFKRELDGYKTNIDPIKNYMQQAVNFAKHYGGLTTQEAIAVVKSAVAKKGARDPLVKYRNRLESGDREEATIPLSKYIKETVEAEDVLAPSFTVYDNPKKKKSLHAGFLKINTDRRSKHKKASLAAYQNGDMDKFTHHDVLQKVMKIFNNSLSGAYASKSTMLYNPSQHYTLTSITRSVASIGNALTESMIAGNKCLYTPESVMNYITATISGVNLNSIASAMSKYNLYYPTPDDVLCMLKYSSDRYWSHDAAYEVVDKYLRTLNKYELAAVMYVNDMFHLMKHNDAFVREFIGSLSERVEVGSENPLKDLRIDIEGINNLVHLICMDDIRGMDIRYDELEKSNPKLLMILGSTANHVYQVLNKYHLLIKTFYTTDILPIDIANIKDCYRDAIVLSDTDSTCGSYDAWTKWYFGYNRFEARSVALAAAVMTINTQVIDHNIRVFAKNMNIEDELVSLLKMKNEFFWSAFVTANISKHYFANTWVREGNVFGKAKLELKGVHLIASSSNQEIVSEAHRDMNKFLSAIEENEMLDPKVILTKVADTERKLLKAIDEGKIDIFKMDKIKPFKSYKDEVKSKTPYFHHMLWMDVFSDKYGYPGDPTYMTIKVPTVLKSKKKMREYLETIEDGDIKAKLTHALEKYKKDQLGTFRVPMSIASGKGIPVEMLKAVDKHRMVLDNMNIYYIQLEALSMYRNPKLLFSEMGY